MIETPPISKENFLFAGGEILADAMTVIETAKLSSLAPEAYLADILVPRIRDHDSAEIDDLLPWNWTGIQAAAKAG